jgi:hypothetical protein
MMTQNLPEHEEYVRCVQFLPDGRTIASASDDATVRLSDVETGRPIHEFTGHNAKVCALAISRDGQTILSGDTSGEVRQWDLKRVPIAHQFDVDTSILADEVDTKPNDPDVLKRLGEWYAFRGKNDWAIECLERARTAGAEVSPLMLARCYWHLGRREDAQREFNAASSRNERPAEYLNLCIAAEKLAPPREAPSSQRTR